MAKQSEFFSHHFIERPFCLYTVLQLENILHAQHQKENGGDQKQGRFRFQVFWVRHSELKYSPHNQNCNQGGHNQNQESFRVGQVHSLQIVDDSVEKVGHCGSEIFVYFRRSSGEILLQDFILTFPVGLSKSCQAVGEVVGFFGIGALRGNSLVYEDRVLTTRLYVLCKKKRLEKFGCVDYCR